MAAAGYPGGRGFPALSILTSKDDPAIRAVVRTLHRNLGITAVQNIEDPALLAAKRQVVQPRNVGYFATEYTGMLTWRTWVSTNYTPTQTQLLSLEPAEYTRYQGCRRAEPRRRWPAPNGSSLAREPAVAPVRGSGRPR
jgi:hypothetical protein